MPVETRRTSAAKAGMIFCTYGMPEGVPLGKANFSASSEAQAYTRSRGKSKDPGLKPCVMRLLSWG